MYRAQVLAGYRRLFRARKVLFQEDHYALQESKTAIRNQFEQNRILSIQQQQSPEYMQSLILMIDDAVDMLQNGFVRGKLNPISGNYEVKIQPHHTQGGGPTTSTNTTTLSSTHHVEPLTKETIQQFEKQQQQQQSLLNGNVQVSHYRSSNK